MENKRKFRPDPDLKLMDQVRQVLRYHHYAYRTENTYCDWIVRYINTSALKSIPGLWVKPKLTSQAALKPVTTPDSV